MAHAYGSTVGLRVSDPATGDRQVQGYLALPAAAHGHGVLVLHAWWGLTRTFMDVCDRLGAAGFAALAPDLYGDGRTASTIDEAQALIATINGSRTKATLGAAIDLLHAHPAVIGSSLGAVGFSMGASWAMYLSTQRPDDVAAVVAFYGAEEADYTAARAAYLGHYAEDDEWEPADGVKGVQDVIAAAGRDVTFYKYPGTKHWFAEPDRPDAYDPAAADLAWDRTVAFLHRHLQDT